MTKPVRIDRRAEADILEAFAWYEDKQAGLGSEFIAAFDVCVESIRDRPTSFSHVHRTIQRALLDRFPYGVYFEDRTEVIVIFANNASRSVNTWRSRVL